MRCRSSCDGASESETSTYSIPLRTPASLTARRRRSSQHVYLTRRSSRTSPTSRSCVRSATYATLTVSAPSSCVDLDRLDGDQVPELLLERALHDVLRRRDELRPARLEDEAEQAAAEVGPHHALARRGEEHLLDQVAQVVVGVVAGRAAAPVDVVREVDVRVMSRAPAAGRRPAASACRSGCRSSAPTIVATGTPPASTRTAPLIHCPVTHGGAPVPVSAQPVTAYGEAIVTTGCPDSEHARKRRERRRRPGVRAHDDGAEMECGRHGTQTTVSAPTLTSVVGPSMLITAPLPFEMMIPTSLTEIIAPVVVWIRMPPVGPGTSLTTMPFFSVVWIVKPFTAGRHDVREHGHLGGGAPVAADPDRPVRVALLELDPDARADLRHREDARVDPGTGRHGIAHDVGITPETSGTIAWIRPICIGSTLLTTVPRYLP